MSWYCCPNIVKPLIIKCQRESYKFKFNWFYTNGINNIIVILLRLGMRRQKLSLQNIMMMLLTMKAAWMREVRVKMIRTAFTMMKMVDMMMMRRKRMITKYQDYNWYNSSVITERKDNHMLQIIYYKEGKNDKVKMKTIR